MGRKKNGIESPARQVLLAALAGIIAGGPAFAQASACIDGECEASLDDIVVTATRRDASMAAVPLSLVAVDRSRLDRDRVISIADLARTTPGLSLRNGWGDSTKISIRGIASTVGTATTGIYIDDTPIQVRSLGAADIVANAYPEIFDLERIEVLRGPQGTLFGAGSEGGTVRFITSPPSLDRTEIYGKASVATTKGGAESWSVGASASTPLIEDRIGVSLAAFTKKDGGWLDRAPFEPGGVTVDKNINRRTATSLRGAVAFAPTETLTLTPSIFYQKWHRHDTDQYWEALSDPDAGDYVSGAVVRQPASDRFYLPALKGELDLGAVRLITNTSWFDRRNHSTMDYSYHMVEGLTRGFLHSLIIPGFEAPSYFSSSQKAFTQEARLQSTDPNAAFSWTAGVFYQNVRQRTQQDIVSPLAATFIQLIPPLQTVFGAATPLPGDRPYASADRSKDTQIAGFGQIDWRATEQLTLTLGGRVARTKFSFANMQDGPINFGPSSSSGSAKETPFTPKFGGSFKPDAASLIYANAAKGFRTGGGNTAVPAAFCATDLTALGLAEVPQTYKSDSVWSYEVGAKKANGNGRINVQASAFLIDWKNIQQSVPLTTCGFAFTANLGKAISKGFDAQLSIQPIDGLTLRTSLAYADSHYSKTVFAPVSGALLVTAGDKLPGSPWQVRLSGAYDFKAAAYPAFVQVNYDYASSYLRAAKIPAYGADPQNQRAEATHYVGARAGASFGPVQAALFVDNLLNSTDATFRTRDSLFSDYFRRVSFRPRTVGIELIFRN